MNKMLCSLIWVVAWKNILKNHLQIIFVTLGGILAVLGGGVWQGSASSGAESHKIDFVWK